MKLKIFLFPVILTIIICNSIFPRSINKNNKIDNLMSQYEDLTEFSLNMRKYKIVESIKKINEEINLINNILTIESFNQLKANQNEISKLSKNQDYASIALIAVDSYKILALELDYTKLKIPQEVVLFDYVGFKIKSLLIQKVIDWNNIKAISKTTENLWDNVKVRIKNDALKDLVSDIVLGLKNSVSTQNKNMLNFGAQMNLDAVDLLEAYFEK